MNRWITVFAGVLAAIALVGCGANPPSVIAYEDLPAEGDPERGAVLYDTPGGVTPACSGCHVPEAVAAPSLLDYTLELAASRVEGEDAREYTFYSIVEPGRYIVEGYGNAMYNRYDEEMSPQDIADLMAYLLEVGVE